MKEFSKRELKIIRDLVRYSSEGVTANYMTLFDYQTGKNIRVKNEEFWSIIRKVERLIDEN